MYKKRSSVCFMISLIFNSYAMDTDYQLVQISDNESALAASLERLDHAYKTREHAFLYGKFNADIKETIKTHKKEYYDLVKEKKDFALPEDNSRNLYSTVIILENQGIETVLFTLPFYINPKNITHVNFTKNKLKDVPFSLLAKTMPNIQSLVLSHNDISYVSTHGKHSLSELTHLLLDHNKITKIDLISLLKKCPKLLTLDLSYNPLDMVIPDIKNIGITSIHEAFALDVRNTLLSSTDIAVLKKYCLAGIHCSFGGKSYAGFCVGSALGSFFGWGIVSLCAQQVSLMTSLGGVGLAIGVAGVGSCIFYKKSTGKFKEFNALRYDDTDVVKNAESTTQGDTL